MPRHLSEADIDLLATTIDTLDVANWNAVVTLAKKRLGHAYTRQALSNYPRIKMALEARKEHLKNEQPGRQRQPKTDTEAALLNRIASLDAQIARLTVENEALMTQLAIWAYNTHLLGIPDHRLNAPLQPVDRSYSEENT